MKGPLAITSRWSPIRGALRMSAVLWSLVLPAGPSWAAWPVNGLRLCTAPGDQLSPVVAADGVGGAVVVWTDHRSGPAGDLYAQRILPSGQIAAGWPATGVAVCTAANAQGEPVLAAVGGGDVIVAWEDRRSDPQSDVYALRLTAGGQVAAGWPAGGLPVRVAARAQVTPTIAPDGEGGVYIAWKDCSADTMGDIFVQRLTASGAVAPGWPATGENLCHAVGEQAVPQLVPDVEHGALLAWRDFRGGTPDLYAFRILSSGAIAPIWPLEGFPVCAPSSYSAYRTTSIVPDDSGGLLLTYTGHVQAYSVYDNVYAYHVSGDGWPVSGWATNGNALALAAEWQHYPVAVPDGENGLVVTWGRPTPGILVCQRITANGALASGWPATGVVACSLAAHPVVADFTAVSDGAGGVLISWVDEYDSGYYFHLYAQRVTANGSIAPGWPAARLPICTAQYTQQEPAMAPDGAGGAYVVWMDGRYGATYWNVYAQRVSGSGVVGATAGIVAGPSPAGLRLLAPRPNPARGPTVISIEAPRAVRARIQVLDVQGRTVRALANDQVLPAGRSDIAWNGLDDSGRLVPPGAYRITLDAGPVYDSRLIVILR